MMNELNTPIDHLYEQAKKILAANPGIGKKRLGQMLGIKTPSSRLRIFRYRGETQGHGTEPDYIRVRQLKEANLARIFHKHFDFSRFVPAGERK